MTQLHQQTKVTVDCQNRVLVCRIEGSWTKEVTKLLISEVQSCIASLSGRAWVRVMDLQSWTLVTPDALELMRELTSWEDNHGCVQRCFVGLNQVQQQLLDFKSTETHKPMHFSHLDTAIGYARQRLQEGL